MSDTAAAVPAIGPPFEPVETVNGKKATSFLDQYLALSPAMSLYEFAAIVQPMGPMAVPVLSCPFTHSVPHRITLGVSRSRGCGCAGGGCGCAGGGAGALAEVRVRWRGPFLSTFSEAHVTSCYDDGAHW